MNLNTDKLMTRQEVCDTLGVCLGTFIKLINEQELPVIQIGRRVFVKQSDLESWIETKRGLRNAE